MNPESKEMDYEAKLYRMERQVEAQMLLVYERTGTRLEFSQEPIDMDQNKRLDRLEWMTENLMHLMSNEVSHQTQEQPITYLDLVIDPDPVQFPEILEIPPWRLPSLSIVSMESQFTSRTPLTINRPITTVVFQDPVLFDNMKPELIDLFRNYVEAEGIVHTNRLNFHFACEGLKQQTDATMIVEMIRSIYKFLLRANFKVTDMVRRAIINSIRGISPDTNVFDPIQIVVKNVIFATTYRNFLSSNIYLDHFKRRSSVVVSVPMIHTLELPKELKFTINLKVVLFSRYRFIKNSLEVIIRAEINRFVIINYIRDRHMEWEIAWKKNFDLF